jgi:hypothetical protein
MASGGAGVGPAPPSREEFFVDPRKNSDLSSYIYQIDPSNIEDNIYIGSTYKYDETLVTCLLSEDSNKYLKNVKGEIIPFPLSKPLYTNKPPPPPSVAAVLARVRAPNRNSILKYNLSSYVYPVNPALIIPGESYKYNETLVYWVLNNDTGKYNLKNEKGEIIPLPLSKPLYANKLPDIDAFVTLINSKEKLSKEQSAVAIDFITHAEDLTYKNSDNETLLMISIKNSHGPIAAALITKVDLAPISASGDTAADYFCANKETYNGKVTVREMLKLNNAPTKSNNASTKSNNASTKSSACLLQGGRRNQRTKKARKQTRRRHARKSRRTTRK